MPTLLRTSTLKIKVAAWVALALAITIGLFTYVIVDHIRAHRLRSTIESLEQVSMVIAKSTRSDMMGNERAGVRRVIQDVGREDKIERVRILDKSGTIVHSSYPPEIGEIVDRDAEACSRCHDNGHPLTDVSLEKRSRIFQHPARDHRDLGVITVIRNEPACASASCHQHAPSQTVLGVLDVTYSLKRFDRDTAIHTWTIVLFAVLLVIIASFSVSAIVHRTVYVPLRDLEAGAKRISSGNLDELLKIRTQDEFGHLTHSFNNMTVALRKSEAELQEWGRTLEDKVAEKTNALELAKAQTVHAEKLASVGMLAAGIAHEINNPLTAILTFTSLLRRKFEDGTRDADDLDLVIRETKRCSAIIRRLLDFAREKTPNKGPVDINELLEETIRLVGHNASVHAVEIVTELDETLPKIFADGDQIKQVFMNMIVNAQDAIEDEGLIAIRSRVADSHEGDLPFVEIEFSDNGCGIPEASMHHIFDPFFTSKGVGQGTGLGLSVSYGIIRSHGGTVDVDSQVDLGSTFRVRLPIDASTAADEASTP